MKCVYCGEEIAPTRKSKLYCSKRCSTNASKERRGIKPTIIHKAKCLFCGKEFETVYSRRIYCSERCRNRKRYNDKPHRTWNEYVKAQKEWAKENEAIKKIEKRFYIASHTIEKKCVVCGETFYCLDNEWKKTCSKACSRRRTPKDKRIPKEQMVDRDITPERLFKRDSGKCWICGTVCDWNDKKVSESGFEYHGDTYPEVDHVIPISRGGMHSWDNVRIACRRCNWNKRDNIIESNPLDHEFAYKEKRKGNPPKRTIQMTLDGVVVKIWGSTGQIRRELGLNEKRIQAVCTGKGRTAFGYRWEYEPPAP